MIVSNYVPPPPPSLGTMADTPKYVDQVIALKVISKRKTF